jgi:hypothetical protein
MRRAILSFVALLICGCSNSKYISPFCLNLEAIAEVYVEALPRDLMTRTAITPQRFKGYRDKVSSHNIQTDNIVLDNLIEACRKSKFKEIPQSIDARGRILIKLESGSPDVEVFVNRTGHIFSLDDKVFEVTEPLATKLSEVVWKHGN